MSRSVEKKTCAISSRCEVALSPCSLIQWRNWVSRSLTVVSPRARAVVTRETTARDQLHAATIHQGEYPYDPVLAYLDQGTRSLVHGHDIPHLVPGTLLLETAFLHGPEYRCVRPRPSALEEGHHLFLRTAVSLP